MKSTLLVSLFAALISTAAFATPVAPVATDVKKDEVKVEAKTDTKADEAKKEEVKADAKVDEAKKEEVKAKLKAATPEQKAALKDKVKNHHKPVAGADATTAK